MWLLRGMGCFSAASEKPQLLILGLEQAGKTTLLYRLRLGKECPAEDEMRRMREFKERREKGDVKERVVWQAPEDHGYHYEVLQRPLECGIWEVPGTPALRHVWKSFYRNIRIHGIIFVVDKSREDDDRYVDEARKEIHFLMNEDELRKAVFVVIMNDKQTGKRAKAAAAAKGSSREDEEDMLSYKLGLHDLHPCCKWKVKYWTLDVSELKEAGLSQSRWNEIAEWIRKGLTQEREGYMMNI
jgi:ADP-ribosylation factor protein 6